MSLTSPLPHRWHGWFPRSTLRADSLANRKVCFPIIVEERDVLRLRRALIQSGGGAVDIIRTTRIRKSTRVRLSVHMERLALERTMLAVINALESAEFGRIESTGEPAGRAR